MNGISPLTGSTISKVPPLAAMLWLVILIFFLHHIAMHNEIKPGIFWVVCLSGVGVEGRDPGCWGLWHGDTFECGRYDGARMGVRVDTRQTMSCFYPSGPV